MNLNISGFYISTVFIIKALTLKWTVEKNCLKYNSFMHVIVLKKQKYRKMKSKVKSVKICVDFM